MRSSHPTRRRGGFTLVELLVVIGIIALLISILLPSLNGARNSARKVKCQANLHNIGNALMTYASSNRGRLPSIAAPEAPPSGVNWMWDISVPMRDALVRNGASRETLYCPASPSSDMKDSEFVWYYDGNAARYDNALQTAYLRGLTETKRQSYTSIIGYVCLIRRAPGPGTSKDSPGITYPTAPNYRVTPVNMQNADDPRWTYDGRTWKYQTSIVPDNKGCRVEYSASDVAFTKSNSSSETEIFADVVGTDTNTPTDFSILPGGLSKNLYQGTNHLGRNKLPAGANVLFLDGHVSWRPFGNGSKYNPFKEGGLTKAKAQANDYFNQDSVRWRATGVASGTGSAAAAGQGIEWFW